MTIYIDSDCRCHVDNAPNLRPVETTFFGGKCDAFIEGYRFVPKGETWIRFDGVVFHGEMVAPWRNYSELAEIQKAAEEFAAQQAEEMAEALKILGVSV